jgi:hypothetical protein
MITAPAAYGIVWRKPRGRRTLMAFMLMTQMLPAIVFVIPLFIVFTKINLVNTLAGLILADPLAAPAHGQEIPGAYVAVATHLDGVAVIGEALGVDEIVGQPGTGGQGNHGIQPEHLSAPISGSRRTRPAGPRPLRGRPAGATPRLAAAGYDKTPARCIVAIPQPFASGRRDPIR